MSAPVLVADSVTKSFGSRRVLTAGSLRAVPGEVRVMFGRNGIGKSTLMKIAAGVLWADSGTVRIDDRVFRRPTLPQLARAGVFYLPDHDLLSPSFSVGAQLAFFEQRFGARSALEAARRTRIELLLDQRPQQLSGGELRRAELAAALTRRPRCLLADEPFRGIAPIDHDALTEILLGMAADGCAVVVTGHEVPSLLSLAHHITWCTAGTTIELGPPAEALRNASFQRDYILSASAIGR